MIYTKNQLKKYLYDIIKESVQKNPNVGTVNINGEDFIVYNNLTHFKEFSQQIIAGQEEGATGFGQYFEQVMLGFLDKYKPLNTDGFNFPFADIYQEDGINTILYSVKMKRKLDPNSIGGGKITPSQIRASLNNHVTKEQFLDTPIQYGLVSGEIDPISFGKVKHIGLPIKLTQFSPTEYSPIFELKKATGFEGLGAPEEYIEDYNPNPYYPLNEGKIKNTDSEFYYITAKNISYENAATMLGAGIDNPTKASGGKYSKLKEFNDGYVISADDRIFDIKNDHPSIVSHNDIKSINILIQNNPDSKDFIEKSMLPKMQSSVKSAISSQIKPSTKVISTKDDFLKLFMNNSKKSIPLLNVIITGGFVSAEEAISHMNNQSSPPSNIASIIQEVDKMIVLALPNPDQAIKDSQSTRIISLMLLNLLGSAKEMIKKTKLVDSKNFPNGFFCRIDASGRLAFNFAKDLDNPLFAKTKGDYDEELKQQHAALLAKHNQYKSDLADYNKRKKAAKKAKQSFEELPPSPVAKPATQKSFLKTQGVYPENLDKSKQQIAIVILLKILIQELLSGITGIDYLFSGKDPQLVQSFKLACQEFYLLKKVSDDSLQGKLLTQQEIIEHQTRIENYRKQIVLPEAERVLPQQITVPSTQENLTFNDLLRKLNIGPVSIPKPDKDIIPESLTLIKNELTPHEVIRMICSLGDLLDNIILIAKYDINLAISLLSGQQMSQAAESVIYEKILLEILKYSRR